MNNQRKRKVNMKQEVMQIPNGELEIRQRIRTIRGVQVMLDRDLAELYGVEVKQLNRQVKRNIERFPADFMFQLTKEDCIRCQIGTLYERGGKTLNWSTYLPLAFAENGIAMLSGASGQLGIRLNPHGLAAHHPGKIGTAHHRPVCRCDAP